MHSCLVKQFDVEAKNCMVVGDRIRSEILQGNIIGTTTVWLQQGKFFNELPETPEQKPDFTIKSLNELIPIIESLNS